MLKRKATTEIKSWIQTKDKKCLVVQGARQTGKTYIIERFAETNYEELVEINFKQMPSAIDIFTGDLIVDNMVMAMRFRFPDKKIIPGKTLIFLDEIQECPEAITSLKFWAIDNRFDVVVSGSLLGIDYNRASSYPVGYVDYLKMYGMDFEEFLWAMGISQDMIKELRNYLDTKAVIPEAINTQMMNYYRQYIAIGGMPEAVQKYIDTKDFREVDKIQRNLLQGYQYDIAHYATAEEKVKSEKCYLSLAKQLLDKENHKFQYKEVERGGRAQKYFSSLEWLLRADMLHVCRLVTAVRFDLDDYARDDFFRAYTTDLSLLLAMKDFTLKQHIVENTLSGNSKGGIFECAIADALYKKGYQLYFYKSESSKREIDFMIQKEGQVVPIEVKSGKARANSLRSLLTDKEISYGYKFIDGNIGVGEDGMITLPLYMVAFIEDSQ
ncbi:MAG: ATP-binding protein [Eubacteriales bacterium]|nr:ATP-binding protein [Eubacteriales bacterium]